MMFDLFRNRHRYLHTTWVANVLLVGSVWLSGPSGLALAQEGPGGCGSLKNSFGPYDYRPEKYVYETTYKSYAALLNIVESAHFTIETELLRQRDRSRGITPGADLSYTLRAFPNHHRGLMTLVRLGELEKTSQPKGSIYSIDCWFRRATTFARDDTMVRMVFAQYLSNTAREKEAEQELSFAASQAGDNAFTQYNIGMIYFDLKNYEKALFHAHNAYALGFERPALKEKLKSVNKWSEPAGTTPVAQ